MLIGHKKQWEFLKKKAELNRLSHAYLFKGSKNIGKKTFAIELAKLLNCLSESNKPCQKCVNCHAIEKNSFPDLRIISASEKDEKLGDGGEIKILQIRQANNFLSYKSYSGLYKIVVVEDAEKMNQEAQNCFLKTLEEPKGKTLLILISSTPDILLSTIASRCQTVKFFRPEDLPVNAERARAEQEILDNLLPVINSNLAEKFKYAKSIDFQKQKLEDIIDVILGYFRKQLLVKAGVIPRNVAIPDIRHSMGRIIEIVNLTEDINKRILFTNVNPKLALEVLLLEL